MVASQSCNTGGSSPVCILLLICLAVIAVVDDVTAIGSSGQPPKPRQVFTNSFLVRLQGAHNHQQADQIARRNGFENLGSVRSLYAHLVPPDSFQICLTKLFQIKSFAFLISLVQMIDSRHERQEFFCI